MKTYKEVIIGDYIIGLAVFIQPVLILLQHVLIDVFRMDPDATTTYRVVLTAIPMIMAIFVGVRRKPARFLVVYVIVFLVLLLTISFFPANERYVKYEGTRFLLPLVIPSAVCLTVVVNMDVLKKSIYIMAWMAAVLVLYYIASFFMGRFVIDHYNMSFSYGCLLPMVVLFSQHKVFPTIVSLVMFITVIAIGSRGGAIIFVAYVLIDVLINRRKGRWYVLLLGILFVIALPSLMAFFDSISISSRTMSLLNSGDITYDSGRDNIYQKCLDVLLENPVLGVGLFGDRAVLGGAYCHNLFLEIGMNYGLFFGLFVVFSMIVLFGKSYFTAKGEDRSLLMVMTFSCLLPHMVSGSYLISNNVALWLGIMLLLIRNSRHKQGRVCHEKK